VRKINFLSQKTTFPEGRHDKEDFFGIDTVHKADDTVNSLDKLNKGDELDGKLEQNLKDDHERLAHTVLNADLQNIDEGMIVQEAFNQNIGSFMPDMMFAQMVDNYKNAKKLYGNTLIRELSGYDPRFVEKNVKIPEFQRELKKRLKDSATKLEEKNIITAKGQFTKEALLSAALFLIDEEFQEQKGQTSSFGEHVHFASDNQGEKSVSRPYKKGDKYKDIAIKEAIKTAIRRGHKTIQEEDLFTYERESRQQINIIYALDVSGSMKGEKLKLAKKAGVALAHKAIKDRNSVGLVLFGSEIQDKVPLTNDLFSFVSPLTKILPGAETDLGLAILTSSQLLESAKGIKHIIILTDALHTTSKDPKKAVLEQVAIASHQNISISIVGVNLDDTGMQLAQSIVDLSKGRLHGVVEAKDIGGVIIADYERLL
jgi:Mg-chelatase subunit ChlD